MMTELSEVDSNEKLIVMHRHPNNKNGLKIMAELIKEGREEHLQITKAFKNQKER